MIEVHTVERVTCPPEVTAALPPAIARPADAVLSFNVSGGAYVGDRFRREETLASRLGDAARQCPNDPRP